MGYILYTICGLCLYLAINHLILNKNEESYIINNCASMIFVFTVIGWPIFIICYMYSLIKLLIIKPIKSFIDIVYWEMSAILVRRTINKKVGKFAGLYRSILIKAQNQQYFGLIFTHKFGVSINTEKYSCFGFSRLGATLKLLYMFYNEGEQIELLTSTLLVFSVNNNECQVGYITDINLLNKGDAKS